MGTGSDPSLSVSFPRVLTGAPASETVAGSTLRTWKSFDPRMATVSPPPAFEETELTELPGRMSIYTSRIWAESGSSQESLQSEYEPSHPTQITIRSWAGSSSMPCDSRPSGVSPIGRSSDQTGDADSARLQVSSSGHGKYQPEGVVPPKISIRSEASS